MASKNSGRKTTAKRSTTRKSTSSRNKKQANKIDKNNNGLYDEVILLLLMAFSILLLLSNFHLVGAFGEVVSGILFGVFGFMGFFAPVLLFLGACFVIANRGNDIARIKIISIIVLFILLCIFSQMVCLKNYTASNLNYYQYSYEFHKGGGFLGGTLAGLLYNALGSIGTYLLLIVLGIICVVFITEKSFLGGVKKGSEKVYRSAKEDSDRRRELRAERMREQEIQRAQEEREREQELRMNKKVSGVVMNTEIIKPDLKESDDIHEITMEQLNDHEFDVESIQIKMADTFAEEAKIELAYDLPRPEEIESDMENVEIIEKPKAITSRTKKVPEKENEISNDFVNDMAQVTAVSDKKPYQFPPLNLLARGKGNASADSKKELTETAMKLQQTLANFGVKVTITEISQGPTVTRYEMQPEQGVKVSKIVNLSDDIKLNLAATDIRIEAPIPGKAAIGIEVPNKDNSTVMFRDLLENNKFEKFPSNIAFAVGKDISGDVIVTDIAKMPHLLIAGATGSGKSVCINTLIMSILYKAHPDDVKMIMVDPKVVELSVYNGIPHLMIPVVTDPKKAAAALHWGVAEMTDRYQKFADFNVRDLKGYNKKVSEMKAVEGEEPLKKLPQIIIIVDELADLMMVSPGEVEESICRLAQLARAAGIHLIIATQRPSVDVITGLIKANMPSRIAFSVSSGVDSRTILDMNGAEKLLGKGDMLFYPQGYTKPARVQGAFVSDKEVQDIVDFLKEQSTGPLYSAKVEAEIANVKNASGSDSGIDSANEKDTYFVDAAKFIIEKDKASIGMLQRVFKIGFNRAARIMDQLADAGVVGEEEGTKPRKILMSEEQFEQYIEEYL
ncbi:MAG: DNA translocase FtsK [Lachnospiraceae bacterium]|nr:DNA translocase FtsK [Lachnospiraceae bacterium]